MHIKHVRILYFYLTLNRISISIPGLNLGFPYLVCKNMVSDQPTLLATHPEVLDIPTGSQMDLFKFTGKYGKELRNYGNMVNTLNY